MSTSKADLNKILTKLEPLGVFTARPMMGEFLLYHNGILIGGVYDCLSRKLTVILVVA